MSFPKDQKIIQSVKSATVAIGLIDVDSGMIGISGSGFIYDSRGYIITATHVLNSCVSMEKSLQTMGKNVETIAIRSDMTLKKAIPFILNGRATASRDPGQPKMPTPDNYDIALAKIKNDDNVTFPSVEICKPYEIKISDEIAMCGFPRGPHSLSTLTTRLTGVRLSPPMQFGHVAAILPYDEVEYPYGIQTDIIGTSSSSGSPLIDPNSGKVMGIAQNVIPANFELNLDENDRKFFNNKKKLEGEFSVGLVWGDICNRLYNIPDLTKDGFEKVDQQKLKTTITRFNDSLGAGIKPNFDQN